MGAFKEEGGGGLWKGGSSWRGVLLDADLHDRGIPGLFEQRGWGLFERGGGGCLNRGEGGCLGETAVAVFAFRFGETAVGGGFSFIWRGEGLWPWSLSSHLGFYVRPLRLVGLVFAHELHRWDGVVF